MRQKKLNHVLKEKARELGLCDEWYNAWGKKESTQELIEKYLKGINFCNKHDYPNVEFARKYFPKDILHQNNIYLDDIFEIENKHKIVILGESKGKVILKGDGQYDLYIRHNSEIYVLVEDGAKAFIETRDNCKVKIRTDDYSKVYIYRYSGEISFEGEVIIREKSAD